MSTAAKEFGTGAVIPAEEITTTGQRVNSECGVLTVVACGWSKQAAEVFGEAAIIAGEICVERWTGTADGRSYRGEWHTGESTSDVYAERWEQGARVFHGWIDAGSRKIVQAG